MVNELFARKQRKCADCGVEIPMDRLKAVPRAEACVECQALRERKAQVAAETAGRTVGVQASEVKHTQAVEMKENRMVVGNWSGGLMQLAAQSSEFRNLLRTGRKEDARALVQSLPAEAQAAIVVMDDDPEEALSITGMDQAGNPGYLARVVDILPTEMLAGLISQNPNEKEFNTHLLQAMSPGAFKRTLEETLEPMDNAEMRTKVSWEWLRALAALRDFDKRTELLRSVDTDLLEEALFDRLADLDLNAPALTMEVDGFEVSISRFRLFSEEGAVGQSPSAFLPDPDVGEVMDALHEADPALFRQIVRGAWERQSEGEEGSE